MKHSTPESMKFKKLKRRLGLSTVVTVGTLELLWLATQKNAKRGDIGRFSNEEIAIECDWNGDPDELVEALIDAGWIDRCQVHRLVIHDWHEHCPTWITGNLKSQKISFAIATPLAPPLANGYSPTLSDTAKGEDYSTPLPNLTQPNPTKPNETYSVAITPRDIFSQWNAVASTKGLTTHRRLTEARISKIKARLKQPEWVDDFTAASEKLPIPGDGWQPDLEWMIANDTNVSKILEGKYDWRGERAVNGRNASQKSEPVNGF